MSNIKQIEQSVDFPRYYLVEYSGVLHLCLKVEKEDMELVKPDFGNWLVVHQLKHAEDFESMCFYADEEFYESMA